MASGPNTGTQKWNKQRRLATYAPKDVEVSDELAGLLQECDAIYQRLYAYRLTA